MLLFVSMFTLIILFIILYVNCGFFFEKEGIVFTIPELVSNYNNYGIMIDKNNKTLKKDGKIISYKNGCNSENGIKNSLNKHTTSSMLKNKGVQVPNYYLYNKNKNIEYNLQEILVKLNYPLVVKPTNGTYGNGVKTNINNKKELKDHIVLLLNKNKNILIEEHHFGNDYRILVIKNEIVAVVQRSKPHVIGDGKSNLKDLIKHHKYNDHKIHNIDLKLIKSQKYCLDSIIPINKKVYVSNVNNYHNGASIQEISFDDIHPANIALFTRINNILDMNINGIDFISNDLSIPYYRNGVIIECNAGADFDIHYQAAYNKDKLINRFIFLLQKLFL